MWPFDNEETENQDPSLLEFDSIASQVYEQAPDVETGLSALRDVYSEYDFIDVTPANESLIKYSDQIRTKFGETQAFDYDSTLEFAPINMDEIVVESEDPEQAKIETINRWEEENLKALAETSDPIQLQAKSQLEMGIRQVASIEKRKFYGADNYLVTDQLLRAGQGAVGGIASLVGADSVNDWFVENTDPDGVEIFGMQVGGDDSYLSATSSGLGSAAGAVGAFAAAGPAGTYAYLGASGAGQVRERVEQANQEGATTAEAISAGALEAASQVGQTLVGGKVFGAAAGKIVGTPVKQFGAKIFPRIPSSIQAMGAEAVTESGGQLVSNISENIATQEDWSKDLGRGLDKAFVAGGLSAGAAHGVGSFAENYRRVTETPEIDTSVEGLADSFNEMSQVEQPSIESLEERAAEDLKGETPDFTFRDLTEDEESIIRQREKDQFAADFADYDGSPPPKPESIRQKNKAVNIGDYTVAGNLSDGSQLVASRGQLYLKKGDQVLQPFSMIAAVNPEVASKLMGVTDAANADGTAITLKKEGNNLVVESEFIDESLNLTPSKTGKTGVTIPLEDTPTGNAVVFVNETSTQNGVRQNNFHIAEGVVKDLNDGALSAAGIGFNGQKVSQHVTNLIKKFGPERSEEFGISTESFIELPDGTVVGRQVPLMTYFPKSNVESGSEAQNTLNQKGVYGSISYLRDRQGNISDQDQALINVLREKSIEMYNNVPVEDIDNKILANDMVQEILALDVKAGEISGRTQQLRTERARATSAGAAVGDFEVSSIKTQLEKQVYDSIKNETGEEVTLPKAAVEAKKADEEVAAIEKEISDPVEVEKANIDAEIADITKKTIEKEIETPIKKFKEEVDELKRREEVAKEEVAKDVSEAKKFLSDEIKNTESKIQKAEEEVEGVTHTELKPTKEQLHKQASLKERAERLASRKRKLEKQANEKMPKDLSESREASFKKKIEKAKEQLASVNEQIEKAGQAKAALDNEIRERTGQTRQPTSEQTKRLNALRSKLTELKNEFENTKDLNPKKSSPVKKLRSLTAERKQAIRSLKKESKVPRELTAKQKQLQKRKEELDIANKEGRIRVDPEVKKRLVIAKTVQKAKKERLTKVQQKLNEELAKFSPEDQAKIKNLYNIRENYQPGSEAHQALSQQIIDIKSKFIKNGDTDTIVRISDMVRRNRLSGWMSQIGNIGGNIAKLAGDIVANAPVGISKGSIDFMFYPYGAVKGLKTGFIEAMDILQGNRGGKLSLGEEGKFKPGKINWKNPFSIINEVASRALSAGDSFFSRAGSVGQGYYHMYQQAEKQKVPLLQRKQWVDDKMWGTTEKKARLAAQVDEEIKVLKDAGVPISNTQRTLMIYQRAQTELDAKTRAIQDRAGLKAAYLEDPEWGLGVIADAIKWIGNRTTFTIKGNIEVNAAEIITPFVRTVANVGNEMMNWTPIGAVRAGYMKAVSPNIPEQGVGSRKGFTRKDLLIETGKDSEGNPIMSPVENNLEIRNVFGKALVGSSLVGVTASLALKALEDNEENPWIEFMGAIPQGEYPEWKLKGKTPYSVRVGTSTYNFQNTPLAMLPVLVDSYVRGVKKGHDANLLAYNATLGSLAAIADLGFVKGVTDFVDMFRKDEISKPGGAANAASNQIKQQIANVGTGFIPSVGFLNNLSKWLNGSPVETYNNLQAKLFGQLPVVGPMMGEPALNGFGEPIKYNFYEKTGMSRFLNQVNTDPVALWMQESGYDFVQIPRSVQLNQGDKISVAEEAGGLDYSPSTTKEQKKALEEMGEKILRDTTGYQDSLSPEQSRAVLKIAGPRIKAFLAEKMQDPDFRVKTEENQDIIDKEIIKIKAEAKLQVLSN